MLITKDNSYADDNDDNNDDNDDNNQDNSDNDDNDVNANYNGVTNKDNNTKTQ